VSLSARDKKLVMLILPVALLVGFWFLVVGPKRQEAADVQAELSKQEQRRDAAVTKGVTLDTARSSFASDYAAVVRLGKAIPATLDVPSLIVQLDRASRGTGIDFAAIRTGEREEEGAPSSASSSSGSGSEGGGSGASSSAQPSGEGAATGSSSAPGLDEVPLEFEFNASFFELADFLHRMKRFVYVADDRIRVRGRLMTIDSITYQREGRELKAEIKATVYLTPKPEGATVGATPEGPAGTGGSATPATASASSPTPPTAAVSP
jgi:hypothetical protein